MGYRAISYGGGVQSTAMVVLAVQGRIEADVALFANVGEDSEHPATLRYVNEVAMPWAAEHGVELHEVRHRDRTGATPTLREHALAQTSFTPLPLFRANGAPGVRTCTQTFKIAAIRRWLRDHGHLPADLLLGISVDELERAGRGVSRRGERRVYPLLELGLTRAGCVQVIRDAGLPVPPKSACYFCPYHRPAGWAEMRRDEPDLFAAAQRLEDDVNDARRVTGKEPGYLTRFGRRLTDAIGEAQPTLDFGTDIGEAGCDEGVCFV